MRVVLFTCMVMLCAACAVADVSYSVTVSIFTHGTLKLHEYRLDRDRIEVERFSTNGRSSLIVESRPLTATEKARLGSFFRSFPLARLKDNYSNTTVQGEIHSEYRITVNGIKKNVYVYFMKPTELRPLNAEINRLIPRSHHLWED